MATAVQLAEAAFWIQQFSAASEKAKDAAAVAAETAWRGFEDWYNPVKVAELAATTAGLSDAAQQITSGLSAQYVAMSTAAVTGTPPGSVPKKTIQIIRNGSPLPRVHTRPAQTYLRSVATGKSHTEALNLAVRRAGNTMMSDLTLQDRATQAAILDRLGIVTFRRIIRPELSVSGTCGLCVAAAGKVYKTGDLMPLHPPSCKCIVMPIIGDNDPGLDLNQEDIGQLFEDAGSTNRRDLARTRYVVHQHGELGPVLAKVDDEFRDQSKARLENDPERARRMLAAALPVLGQYEAREESGERYAAERLDYQRNLVAKLERIIGGSQQVA